MRVQCAVFGVTLLSLIAKIEASTSKADISANFTFEKWIDSIIADPSGEVLTPDEALVAWNHTQATVSHGRLEKRFGCNTIAGTEASVSSRIIVIPLF